MADWNQLLDELLDAVLSHLNEMDGRVLMFAAPFVSKQWRKACREHLRARIDLSPEWATALTDMSLGSIVRRFPKAVSISLNGRAIMDAGVAHVVAACPQLFLLSLERCNEVTDEGVGKLAMGCPHLSSLVYGGRSKVTDKGVQRLRADLPGCKILLICD